jgi:hypothetical protein
MGLLDLRVLFGTVRCLDAGSRCGDNGLEATPLLSSDAGVAFS